MANKKEDIIKENNLTYDDYARLDDGNRYELVQGKLRLMSPAPSTIHQLLSAEMNTKLVSGCANDYFIFYSPIDVILAPKEVSQPDIALVSRKRMNILTNRGIEGAPDLVIEILSPSSLKRDKIEKLDTYAHYGIPEYWIVDPKSGILEQNVLGKDRYKIMNVFQGEEQVTSPHLTCASFTMKEIMDALPDLEK